MRFFWISWILLGLWFAPTDSRAEETTTATSVEASAEASVEASVEAPASSPSPETTVTVPMPIPRPVPSRTGIAKLDRAMNNGKPLSLLPYWYSYPWKKVTDPASWTIFLVQTLKGHGQNLLTTVPADIEWYCPKYKDLDKDDRTMFWARLISILAELESTYNTSAKTNDTEVGPDVISSGLLMLSILSARHPAFGCSAIKEQKDLFDWKKNVNCAVRIMDFYVKRDGVLSTNTGIDEPGEWRGLARYWGPWRDPRLKTRAGRKAIGSLVEQKRESWQKASQKRHPAFWDSQYRKQGETKTMKLMRLLNVMPICH